jgi:hypothetical protein
MARKMLMHFSWFDSIPRIFMPRPDSSMASPNKTIHPDEAVATVQAATLSDNISKMRDLLDIAPLHATADKTTGKSNCITIANDKGRPSNQGIEQIVHETERCNKAAAMLMSLKTGVVSDLYNSHNPKTKQLSNQGDGAVNETDHELSAKYVYDVHTPHPCMLISTDNRCDDAATALMALKYGLGPHPGILQSSKTKKKLGGKLDGIVNELKA